MAIHIPKDLEYFVSGPIRTGHAPAKWTRGFGEEQMRIDPARDRIARVSSGGEATRLP